MDVEDRMTPDEWRRHVAELKEAEAGRWGYAPTPTEIVVTRRVRRESEAENRRSSLIPTAAWVLVPVLLALLLGGNQ